MAREKVEESMVPKVPGAKFEELAVEAVEDLSVAVAVNRALGVRSSAKTEAIVRERSYARMVSTPGVLEEMADDLVGWSLDKAKKKEAVILLEWCVERGISKERLEEMGRVNEVLGRGIEFVRTVEELGLVKGGLKREYSSEVTRLLLMAEHGMAEKREVTGKVEGGMPASVEDADRKIEELREHRDALAGLADRAASAPSGIVES